MLIYRFSLGLLLCCAAVASQAQECSYTLRGQVLDARTGQPVPFANVSILGTGQGTMADAEGNYVLEHLCEETYTIVCSHIACEHQEHEIDPSDTQQRDFLMTSNEQLLVTVDVTEKRVAPTSTQHATQVDGEELGAARGLSLGEALEQLPGLRTVRTGGAGSKPVVQGLRGERVVIVNNGVRLEGQQWGDDHAPEVDPFAAATVTVVRGAAGVRYGAGALGGAVVLSPRALPTQKAITGQLTLGGYSNGRMGLVNATLEGKLGNTPLAWRVRGTAKRGGNLRTPDYFLDNTGVAEYNYGYSLAWQTDHWQTAVHYDRRIARTGIFAGSHIGNLTDLALAIERGRPETDAGFSYVLGRPLGRVTHETVQWHTQYRTDNGHRLGVRLSRQFNRRQEFDAHRRFGEVPTELVDPEIELELTAYQAELDWEHPNWGHWRGGPGVQVNYRRNTTDRGGLLPDYSALLTGVYWIERWRDYPRPWEWELGARYEWQMLDATIDTPAGPSPTRNYSNLSFSAGAIYHLSDALSARLNVSSAYRPPHPNELFSEGVHHGAASYERGNADLTAERAQQLTATLNYQQPSGFSGRIAAYAQWIDDFIYLQPEELPVLTIRGAFPAFRFEQADARLLGVDASFDWHWGEHWQWSGSASVLRARNRQIDDWLILMPADRLGTGLKYRFTATTSLGVQMQHTVRQTRAPEGQDFAPPPAAYTLYNLNFATSFQLGRHTLSTGLTIYNLLDTRYRDYLDRFRYFADAPGRNVAVHLRIPFSNQKSE